MPLETMQMDLEGNPQAFSSVFTDRRSGFFDTGLSTWYVVYLPYCVMPFLLVLSDRYASSWRWPDS